MPDRDILIKVLNDLGTDWQTVYPKTRWDNILGVPDLVTIADTQTITGDKTFTKPIKITSNAQIEYDETLEAIKFVFN